jgi:hypothetical protein
MLRVVQTRPMFPALCHHYMITTNNNCYLVCYAQHFSCHWLVIAVVLKIYRFAHENHLIFCLESYGPVLRNVKDKHEKLCHVCGP